NAICVAVDPIERRPIERSAETMGALVPREIMKTLVGVLGQHQTREQARGFFCLRNSLIQLAAVLFEAFDLANRLEVHLAVGGVQIRKLTRQAFAEEIARNLTWLVNFRQRQAWQRQSGRRPRDGNFRFDVVPASQQFTPELFIRPRALHLIENELVIIFDGFDDLSELAHFFFFLVVAALSKRRSCLVRRSETAATDLFETKLN